MRFTALKTTIALYTPLFDYWAVGASLQNSLVPSETTVAIFVELTKFEFPETFIRTRVRPIPLLTQAPTI